LSLRISPTSTSLADQDVALRITSFALKDRWLFWARARLYADRIELAGWSLRGRYHRVIPLEQIDDEKVAEECLVLTLAEEAPLRIWVDAPERWASAIATYRGFYLS
jgi:hypothetical protein